MPSIRPSERGDETFGEAFIVAERAERHRRYAHLFAKAMTTTDSDQQAAIICEIRRMLRQNQGGKGG